MEKVHVVCPSISDLVEDCKSNICCPIAGCDKILPQKQSLKFHIVKVHGIIKDAVDLSIAKHVKLARVSPDSVFKFLCPASGCQYAQNGSKHFASSKLLKQHYMKVHAPKRYSCVSCSALFGLHRDLTRHEKCCRRRILCGTCGVAFSTQDDLKSHCQLTQHEEWNISGSCNQEAGKVNEAETIPSDSESVCMQSECGRGVNADQLQVDEESQCTDVEPVSSEIDSTHDNINCTGVNSQPTSSTVLESQNCELRMPQLSDESISETVTGHCSKSSNFSRKKSTNKCASVSAELRVGKSCSTVGQLPVDLLPKPMFTLLPIGVVGVPLLAVVNASVVQASGDRAMLPAIAPRPANIICSNTCVPAVTPEVLPASVDHGSLNSDTLMHTKLQNPAASVVTQTLSLPAHPQCKTAATQTSEWFLSRRSKESRASQASSKVRQKRPRDVQHSHTQTHGSNRKLRKIVGSQAVGVSMPVVGTEPTWWMSDVTNRSMKWPDLASNATQTVSRRTTKLESIRTQTVESFLSSSQQEDLLKIAAKLLSDDVQSAVQSSSAFAVEENSSIPTSSSATFSVNMSKSDTSNGGRDYLQPEMMLNDISRQLVDECPSNSVAMQTLQPQNLVENAVFGVNCIGSQTLAPLVDELMYAIDDTSEQGPSSSSHLSRVMLTSASQTMPDFDAVSTQTMDCDFDGNIDIDDFDNFIHTETQTTDMLASYFSFADIETQTASDMQYWDSETQTCFDALLSS